MPSCPIERFSVRCAFKRLNGITTTLIQGAAASDPSQTPGAPATLQSKIMNMGAGAVQSFSPVNKICAHVCGFHMYCHDMTRQVRAHHFCSMVNEDFRQCVIYDSDRSDARLIGIEYIISRRLYEQLPEDEKKYWHSHIFEVTSGMLTLPGLPQSVETQEMAKLVNTYGKTWHTWQVDLGHQLPLGPPQLMMAFVGDGQLSQRLADERDSQYGISMGELKAARAHIRPDPPEAHPSADHPHTNSGAWQVSMEQQQFKRQ